MAVFTRDDARRAYLGALASEAPAVLEELAAVVAIPTAPRFGVPGWDAPAHFFSTTDGNLAYLVTRSLAGEPQDLSYLDERDRAAFEWCLRWRFVDAWAIQWADITAEAWAEGRYLGGWVPYVFRMETMKDPFRFETHRGWRPDRETWATWKAETLDRIQSALSRYRASILARQEVAPIREIPRHHYEWLARAHNLGWTFARIASTHGSRGVDEKTVRAAVRRAAAAIGLTLKRSQRGRPAKLGTEPA